MTDAETGEKLSEMELLKSGLEKLDDALAFLMEMDNAAGQVLAHFIHAALTMGEKIIAAQEEPSSAVDDQ